MNKYTDTTDFLDNISEPMYNVKPNIQYIEKDIKSDVGAGAKLKPKLKPKQKLHKHIDLYYSKNFIKQYF